MRGKTMEHAQKRKINFKGILTSSRTKRIALYALYFLAGLLGSRGMVFVRYAPFGAAAVAAVPIRSMWAVIVGSLVGYIWPSNAMHPIRYIAAIIAIAIIRCILNELVKIRSHPLFAPVVCFVPMLVTGIAMAFINGVTVNSITMYSAEAMLSAAGAYFFQRTSSLITSKRGVGTLNTGELACVVLSLGVAILALDNIAIYDISLGSIAAIILILFAAVLNNPFDVIPYHSLRFFSQDVRLLSRLRPPWIFPFIIFWSNWYLGPLITCAKYSNFFLLRVLCISFSLFVRRGITPRYL